VQKSRHRAMVLNQNERKNTMKIIYKIYSLIKPTQNVSKAVNVIEIQAYYAGFIA
jgi:hypothetical protein